MRKTHAVSLIFAGLSAGAVAGLFGAGGGMVLVPMLTAFSHLKEEEVFPTSLSVMLPVCVACIAMSASVGTMPWKQAVPYLLGSAAGGILAGIWGRNIPVKWLHRGLGILILWGGWRYLWQ